MGAIERFAARSIGTSTDIPERVGITQRGEMRLAPGGRWLPFTAAEVLEVSRIGFAWTARLHGAPIVPPIRVVDAFAANQALLRVTVAGFPIARMTGDGVAQGELLRYLAELPWVPHAIAANKQLHFHEIEGAVAISAQFGSTRPTFTATFDENWDICSGSAIRGRTVGRSIVPSKWSGRFSDYRSFGALRVPASADAQWDLPDGPFVYWRANVLSLDVLA